MDNDPNVAFTFKALKYLKKQFISPSFPVPWEPHGFMESVCKNGREHDQAKVSYPVWKFEECTCGIWSAWEDHYATTYRTYDESHTFLERSDNVLSALFLGQPHGDTDYDWGALTCRSQQYQLVAIVANNPNNFSSVIAAKYFDLPVIPLRQAQIAFDLRMLQIAYQEDFPFEPMYTTRKQLMDFVQSMRVGG